MGEKVTENKYYIEAIVRDLDCGEDYYASMETNPMILNSKIIKGMKEEIKESMGNLFYKNVHVQIVSCIKLDN
jgi:hypothetical protein